MFHALGAAAGLDSLGGGLGGAVAGAVSSLLGGGEGYQFGQHLLHAQADSQVNAWSHTSVGGESPMSGQGDRTAHWLTVNDADYRGEAGSGDPQLTLLDPVARTKDLADRFAAGRLVTAQRTAHQITFTVLGRPQIELGDDLSVSGVPDNLVNGNGYVRAIRHCFGVTSGFVTDIRIALTQKL